MTREWDRELCWTEVDLEALRSNYRLARHLLPDEAPIFPVVKADAYGHGAVEVSRVLVEEGASVLAVATVEEAAQLRRAGIESPVLVMGRMIEAQIGSALRWRVDVTIAHVPMARALSVAAVRKGVAVPVHIKVDTGMTRLGLAWETAHEDIMEISSLPGLKIRCVFTHFANADLADMEFTRLQLERFSDVRRKLEGSGIHASFHIANSAAILTSRAPGGTGVRPGIMLYGSSPSETVGGKGLTPVLSWKCRVLQIRDIPEGTGISYGHDFFTRRPSRIATISVGYADGYMRRLTNQGQVLIRGQRAPVVGRVTMDMTMVDVTGIPGVEIGDEVVLIGTQGDAAVTAQELAAWAGTISYEVLCAISSRVTRVYRDGLCGSSPESRQYSPEEKRLRIES